MYKAAILNESKKLLTTLPIGAYKRRIRRNDRRCLSLYVSDESLDRTLNFLESLIDELAVFKISVDIVKSVSDRSPALKFHSVFIRDGKQLNFWIEERSSLNYNTLWQRSFFRASGRLRLVIAFSPNHQRVTSWIDYKKPTLETKTGAIARYLNFHL